MTAEETWATHLLGGGTWVDITRLADGRIMCQLCFTYTRRDDLEEIEPGVRTDICKPCASTERRQVQQRR